MAPDYEGSENYELVPLWNLKANDLYDPNTYVQVLGPKLNSNFLPDNNLRLGLSGNTWRSATTWETTRWTG